MIYLAIPAVIAVVVIAADWLDWHGTLGPAWWLTLPARLVMPHTGHHRDKYATDARAPVEAPGQDAALEPAPPARAAAPQPHAAPPVAAEVSPGLGRHPFDGHREPWVVHHRPPSGTTIIGYGPFDTGPKAIITDSHVSLRATGARAAIGDGELVPVRPYAEQWWRKWDEAVNGQ